MGLLLLLPLLAACGGTASGATPSPSASATTPQAVLAGVPGGRTLADFGYLNGPGSLIGLPAFVEITTRVDQPNVITALGQPGDAGAVAAYLRASLPSAGWTITGESPEGLTFTRPGWQGAFTVAPKIWGLTLRAQPAN